MIIRITTKLGKKIGVTPTQSLSADPNPFTDWSAHLFTANRKQYILLTHTVTLYSRLIYGRGITNGSQFLKHFRVALNEFMPDDGFREIVEEQIAPAFTQVSFSKAFNRSVTGSMNDLIYQAKYHLIEEKLSPYDISFRLNKTPMSYLQYSYPRTAFQELVNRVQRINEKAVVEP